MSVDRLKQATSEQTGIAKRESFPTMLEKMKPQIALALPRHMRADRMVRIALTEFRKNAALANCDPMSIMASIVMASQIGLEPGVFGQCFLVPYGSQCTLVTGWQGYLDIIHRAGRAEAWTQAVRQGDRFVYKYGTSPVIEHEPSDNPDLEAPITHTYSVGRIKGADWPLIDVWTKAKVDAHLKRYNKVGQRHYALKDDHNWEMYARKVPLLQVMKHLPKSVELMTAASLDYSADAGTQKITFEEAAAGTSNSYDVEGETQDQRIQKLFDQLDIPGEMRDEELAKHKGNLEVLEAQLRTELEKAK